MLRLHLESGDIDTALAEHLFSLLNNVRLSERQPHGHRRRALVIQQLAFREGGRVSVSARTNSEQ